MKNREPAEQPRQVSFYFCVHRGKGSGLVSALHENATNDGGRSWCGRPVPGDGLRTAGLALYLVLDSQQQQKYMVTAFGRFVLKGHWNSKPWPVRRAAGGLIGSPGRRSGLSHCKGVTSTPITWVMRSPRLIAMTLGTGVVLALLATMWFRASLPKSASLPKPLGRAVQVPDVCPPEPFRGNFAGSPALGTDERACARLRPLRRRRDVPIHLDSRFHQHRALVGSAFSVGEPAGVGCTRLAMCGK
jgi:hypothetical protein